MLRSNAAMASQSTVAVALVLGWAVLAPSSGGAAEITGTPTVIDGETLIVAGRRLRLDGIDAPDPRQSCSLRGRRYGCGAVSRTALMDLVAGFAVRCDMRGAAGGGAVFARCTAAGYDLSEGMVYTGWALADRKRGQRYGAIEAGARKARRGLWKGKFARPWDWSPQGLTPGLTPGGDGAQ
jgi:endonuclease YncB( thermonuclease family)